MPSVVEAIGLPFDEAIDFFEGKIRKTASGDHASWAEVYGAEHARAFTVAGAASDALLADFQTEIAKAIRNGTTLADFRGKFDEIVAKHGWQQRHEPGWRAKIIYETNMATAHAAGRYAQMTDPDVLEAYPYWQYVHSGSRHPRIQHLAWNGLTLAHDDAWWDVHYPPNGWRCGCRVRPVSGAQLRRSGRSGPDTAPANTYRPWTNPATGEKRMIPNGIDPGWDYNVGKAWKQGAPPPVSPPKVAPVPAPPVDPRAALARRLTVPGGTATMNDVRVVAEALQRLPVAQLEALADGQVKVVACRGAVTDHATDLKGIRPRGWRPGKTWDDVPGAYRRDTKEVIIATEKRQRVRAVASNHGSADIVAHEVAHALDDLAGGIALPEFVAARTADLAGLTSYERQPGNAGLEETWAESLARHVAGTDAGTPALRAFWLDYLGRGSRVPP